MLRIRPYTKCDADEIVKWTGDEHAFHQWSADKLEYPLTPDTLNAYYESFAYQDSFFPMTFFDENGLVGHLILRYIDKAKTDVRFGFVIVNNLNRGNGYGKALLRLAACYAFDMLGAEKITLGVFENNPSAYHCYKSIGFKEIAGEHIRTMNILGECWACIDMELLKKDFILQA